MSNGVLVSCMLESVAMHSFVHTLIIQSLEPQLLQGAVLTVKVANGCKLLYNDVCMLDLTFMAEGGDRQVTVVL